MNLGRPTDDKKGNTIKLRLNDDMRSYVEKVSAMYEVSMSEYIRSLIKHDMSSMAR